MARKRKIIDTNLLIRYFTNDDTDKAARVESLFLRSSTGEFELPDIIIAEMVWVLLSFYKLSKDEVIEKLEGLLSLNAVLINRPILKRTIDFYREYAISYTDAYLVAYALEKADTDIIYSYDKALGKVKEIKRAEP